MLDLLLSTEFVFSCLLVFVSFRLPKRKLRAPRFLSFYSGWHVETGKVMGALSPVLFSVLVSLFMGALSPVPVPVPVPVPAC